MKKLPIFFLFLAFLSCENFTDGVVKEIDLPPHTPQLAGSLFLDSRDTAIRATVSQTRGIFDTTESRVLDSATVRILEGENEVYRLTELGTNQTYDSLLTGTLGTLSGEVTFEVSHPHFETVHATQQFPSMPAFTAEVDYAATTLYGETSDALTVRFPDIQGENQHYIINIDVHYRTAITGEDTAEYYPLWLESTSQNAMQLNGGAFMISEEGVDRNQSITFATGVNTIAALFLIEYRITVTALSNEAYKFYISYDAFQNAEDNPFAQPVILYSNMSNNIGCFGVSTTKRKWVF